MRDGPKSEKLISLVWVCSFVVILVFVPVETHSSELDNDDDEEEEHEGDSNGLKVQVLFDEHLRNVKIIVH